MLSVTFQQPILIDAEKLHSLLSLAGAPAIVEPYLNGHASAVVNVTAPVVAAPVVATDNGVASAKRTHQTKAAVAALSPAVNPTLAKIKRVRRTKAQMAAAAAPVKHVEPKANPVVSTPVAVTAQTGEFSPQRQAVLDRFAQLIESNTKSAKGVLDQFGVNRFSDLDDTHLDAFSTKLTELGV